MIWFNRDVQQGCLGFRISFHMKKKKVQYQQCTNISTNQNMSSFRSMCIEASPSMGVRSQWLSSLKEWPGNQKPWLFLKVLGEKKRNKEIIQMLDRPWFLTHAKQRSRNWKSHFCEKASWVILGLLSCTAWLHVFLYSGSRHICACLKKWRNLKEMNHMNRVNKLDIERETLSSRTPQPRFLDMRNFAPKILWSFSKGRFFELFFARQGSCLSN